jgi:hypothetical protein
MRLRPAWNKASAFRISCRAVIALGRGLFNTIDTFSGDIVLLDKNLRPVTSLFIVFLTGSPFVHIIVLPWPVI